jgi:hypothetical protein
MRRGCRTGRFSQTRRAVARLLQFFHGSPRTRSKWIGLCPVGFQRSQPYVYWSAIWARHWAGRSRQIPACLPERYGRSYVLPVKIRKIAGIWPVREGPDKRGVGSSSLPKPIFRGYCPAWTYRSGRGSSLGLTPPLLSIHTVGLGREILNRLAWGWSNSHSPGTARCRDPVCLTHAG